MRLNIHVLLKRIGGRISPYLTARFVFSCCISLPWLIAHSLVPQKISSHYSLAVLLESIELGKTPTLKDTRDAK